MLTNTLPMVFYCPIDLFFLASSVVQKYTIGMGNDIKIITSEEENQQKQQSQKTGVYKSIIRQVIDEETGELIENQTETEKVFYEKEPDYVKVYVSDIIRLKGLRDSSGKVLMRIIQSMGYKNVFTAYKPLKQMMASDLGISLDTFNKAIGELKKENILIPLTEYGRGLYLVDPNLFARGKWNEIKDLRLIIEYDTKTGKKKLKSNIREKATQLELFK